MGAVVTEHRNWCQGSTSCASSRCRTGMVHFDQLSFLSSPAERKDHWLQGVPSNLVYANNFVKLKLFKAAQPPAIQ
jgi:hypothetical protein